MMEDLMRSLILGGASLLLATTFSFSVQATEFTLGKITSDIDKDYALLVYDRDDMTGEIVKLYADAYSQGVRIERKEFEEAGLQRGIVLLKKDKYEIVRLQSSNFERARGGTLRLDTLYSAVSSERRVYEFEVLVDPDKVRLETRNGEFNRMHFIAKRSRILGPIGIEKIQFINE